MVGQPHPADESESDDLLPESEAGTESVLTSEEQTGIAEGEDLVLAQLDDLTEEGGLDVETGVEGGLDPTSMVDADDPEDEAEAQADADQNLAWDTGAIDAGGDEDGWTEGSEGDSELYQSDFGDDENDAQDEDGGIDGTDDPLHDGIDEDALPPLDPHDADDTLVDEIEQELLREIAQEA